MSSKYKSRIKKKKTRRLRGGSAIEGVRKGRQVVKAVKKARELAKEGMATGKSLAHLAHSKDLNEFKHRSFHSYHHLHSFVNHATPHVLHAHRAIANMLAGGDEHPFHGNIRQKDFDDFHYPKDVPKEAFKDIARSDRESLRDAVEGEFEDHADGKSGGGLFHAINATAAAAAHWGAKQAKRGKDLHARLKAAAP